MIQRSLVFQLIYKDTEDTKNMEGTEGTNLLVAENISAKPCTSK